MAGPLARTFTLEPERKVDHWWNASRARPRELTVSDEGLEYVYAGGKKRSRRWNDPDLSIEFRNWTPALASKSASLVNWSARNYPYEVIVRPGRDDFTLPPDVWSEVQAACQRAGLPARRLPPQGGIPDTVEAILYSRSPRNPRF